MYRGDDAIPSRLCTGFLQRERYRLEIASSRRLRRNTSEKTAGSADLTLTLS